MEAKDEKKIKQIRIFIDSTVILQRLDPAEQGFSVSFCIHFQVNHKQLIGDI